MRFEAQSQDTGLAALVGSERFGATSPTKRRMGPVQARWSPGLLLNAFVLHLWGIGGFFCVRITDGPASSVHPLASATATSRGLTPWLNWKGQKQ